MIILDDNNRRVCGMAGLTIGRQPIAPAFISYYYYYYTIIIIIVNIILALLLLV